MRPERVSRRGLITRSTNDFEEGESFVMPQVSRTNQDLRQELREQLELLKLDVDHYDGGRQIVAKNIAARLRVLLHDTSRSRSLLQQLGKKDGALFHNTANDLPNCSNPTTRFSFGGLIDIRFGRDDVDFVPRLDDRVQNESPRMLFDSWWNGIVFLDMEGHSFTRKDLLLTLANQDGGSHVDRHLEEAYYRLSRLNSLNLQRRAGDGTWRALSNPHYAAVRQIAHEVLKTFVPGYTAPPSRRSLSGAVHANLRVEFTPHSSDESRR